LVVHLIFACSIPYSLDRYFLFSDFSFSSIGKLDPFGDEDTIVAAKFGDCDECESFLCDECTADIDGALLWACEACDYGFGLCVTCYEEDVHNHTQTAHPGDECEFVEVPNMFDIRVYSIFCSSKSGYMARGNKTIALIGKHPLTVSAKIVKEEGDDGTLFWFWFPFWFQCWVRFRFRPFSLSGFSFWIWF
jgi:hypothetical protein